MVVHNDTILNKMKNELTAAKASQHDSNKFKRHIANIKLLCDLFLEEDTNASEPVTKQEQFSEVELKAMISEQEMIKKIQKQQQFPKTEMIDHDDANGSSIFDF